MIPAIVAALVIGYFVYDLWRHRHSDLKVAQDAAEAEWAEYSAYGAAKAASGWLLYEYNLPPADDLCEFTRHGWDKALVCSRRDLGPAMNAAGLWWRSRASDVIIDGKVLDMAAHALPRPAPIPASDDR